MRSVGVEVRIRWFAQVAEVRAACHIGQGPIDNQTGCRRHYGAGFLVSVSMDKPNETELTGVVGKSASLMGFSW